MTLNQAAKELDGIRNNRHDSIADLLRRVDSIGEWLAVQKHSKLTAKLLTECHQLADRLGGGSGKAGVRMVIG